VREYLISKGIHPNRLDAKGLGEEYPADPDVTDEKNRRVEFIQIQSFTGKR
jgi:outer membrane protein OmpA-like peptidoglycan-associated protein